MRYDIERLFEDLVRERGLDVRLSYGLPAGYEGAFGTFDPTTKTLYMDGAFLAGAEDYEGLYYLLHELRHAVQYQRPELVDDAVRQSARYVIGYDGTCCRLDGDRWSECRMEGDEGYFTLAYQSQPHELDANRFAKERASALLPEKAELIEALAERWLPKEPMDPAEIQALYRRVDAAIEKRSGGARRYDLAIFDLDGTILYTLEDLKNSLNYALSSRGHPERTLEEVRRFVGNGVRKLVERGAPAGTEPDELDRLYETFHVHYKQHDLDNTKPYAGISELLDRLRAAGLRLAVVSNKVDYGVKDLCGRFFPGAFDVAIGERPGVGKKPAPDMVNEALAQIGAARERAVYIGDSEVDIQTARNAGMDEIVVAWGFRTAEELAPHGPKRVAADPEALYRMLTEQL